MIDEKKLIEDYDRITFTDEIQKRQIKNLIEHIIELQPKLDNNLSKDSKWILCSERLPKREEMVLLSVKLDEEPMLIMGELWTSGWTLFGDGYDEEDFEFVAWQPLPEPYKEGDT